MSQKNKTRIGAKAVVSLFTLFGITILASYNGYLRFSYLVGLDLYVSFFIGLFGVLVGYSFFRFWRLQDASRYCFEYYKGTFSDEGGSSLLIAFKENIIAIGFNPDRDARELHPGILMTAYIFIFMLIGLMTITNRGYHLVTSIPDRVDLASTRYCPTEEEQIPDEKKLGCKLLLRAYKLGYAKDLGPCEPKKELKTEEDICYDRRPNEPYLHYMYRLLARFGKSTESLLSKDTIRRTQAKFELQVDRMEDLIRYQKDAIGASPRASHHIFTNLEHPDPWWKRTFLNVFAPSHCIEKYQTQPNAIILEKDDERAASKSTDHAVGHLLFHPRVKPTAGQCKEYMIHWNSPPDACKQLEGRPVEFLKKIGAWKDIETVLKRIKTRESFESLKAAFKEVDPESELRYPVPRAPDEVISFSCLLVGEEDSRKPRPYKLNILDTAFAAQEIRFKRPSNSSDEIVTYYEQLSRLFDPGFRYTGFNSRASVEIDDETIIASLSQPTYLLSKLDLLRNADIFIRDDWVEGRSDLLEVYPYHVHMSRFVETFRKSYRSKKGRL